MMMRVRQVVCGAAVLGMLCACAGESPAPEDDGRIGTVQQPLAALGESCWGDGDCDSGTCCKPPIGPGICDNCCDNGDCFGFTWCSSDCCGYEDYHKCCTVGYVFNVYYNDCRSPCGWCGIGEE